jgi:cyclic pyranopterin phosphate synthase
MNSLVDPFGRVHTYLRIAVTDRCNLRCVYCMPEQGVPWRPREEILALEELLRVARACASLGVRKVRLTGGEPTLRKGIEELVGWLAAVPGIDTVALTTNGVLLGKMAQTLRDAGLTHLNISLDTLRPERFARVARRDDLQRVLAGIDASVAAGFSSLKMNVVVLAGMNDDELLDFVEFVRERPINIRFIEEMPMPGNGWEGWGRFPAGDMKARIEQCYALIPVAAADPKAVAADYRIDGIRGTISFITPLSDAFCERCSRLRLTADGSIKSCLFHPAEVNLRHALRTGATDEELITLIRAAIALKPEAHPPAEELAAANHRYMSDIGG